MILIEEDAARFARVISKTEKEMTMHISHPVLQIRKSTLAVMAAIGAVAVAAPVVVPARGLADDTAGGQRIWTEKAQCPECHGWAADGHGSFHSPGKAPSLRETQLNRDQIRMTI